MYESKNKLFLGMELVKDGRLSDLIKEKQKQNAKFTDIDSSQLLKGILSAVHYIHSNGIMHRDLKPENILIDDKTDLSTVKIIDFGLSHKYTNLGAEDDANCGTLIYMPPEIIDGKNEFNNSVDMWAVGIIMHEVLTAGKHPLYVKNDNAVSYRKKMRTLQKVECDASLSWIAKNLYQRLTMIKSHQRYSAEEALQHPWITRLKQDFIPQNMSEHMNTVLHENSLKRKMIFGCFLSLVKLHSEALYMECSPQKILGLIDNSSYK